MIESLMSAVDPHRPSWSNSHPLFQRNAVVLERERDIADLLRKWKQPVAEVFAPNGSARAELSHVTIGKLALNTSSYDSLVFQSFESDGAAVLVPTAGSGQFSSAGFTVTWSHQGDVIYSDYAFPVRYEQLNPLSMLTVVPEVAELKNTVQVMFGEMARPGVAPLPQTTKRIALTPAGRNFRSLLLSVCEFINAQDSDMRHLQYIGMDDVINRILAQIIHSEASAEPVSSSEVRHVRRSTRALNMVCDHIRSSTAKQLTLTEMEAMTGLTSRALRYAFQERFNCSPREWQRNVQLDKARDRLKLAEKSWSVKEIAFEYGFSSPQSFSTFYRERFGQHPSEVIRTRPAKKPTQ